MHKTSHAQEISARFKQRVEQTGDSLPEEHYDELALLVEAGTDTVRLNIWKVLPTSC